MILNIYFIIGIVILVMSFSNMINFIKFFNIRNWALTFKRVTNKDVEISRSVLNDFGNMSSVTILYVLKKMQEQIKSPNETIYSVAFGPGLTIESMFLKSC